MRVRARGRSRHWADPGVRPLASCHAPLELGLRGRASGPRRGSRPPAATPREPTAPPRRRGQGRGAPAAGARRSIRRRRALARVGLLALLVIVVAAASAGSGPQATAPEEHRHGPRGLTAPRPTPEQDEATAVRSVLAYTPFVKEGSGTAQRDRADLRRRARALHAPGAERARALPRARRPSS